MLSDDAAGFRRAGERNQSQRRMLGDRRRRRLAMTGYKIHNTWRNAGFFASLAPD